MTRNENEKLMSVLCGARTHFAKNNPKTCVLLVFGVVYLGCSKPCNAVQGVASRQQMIFIVATFRKKDLVGLVADQTKK